MLNGFDDIGLTLRHADKIRTYEAQRLATKPWPPMLAGPCLATDARGPAPGDPSERRLRVRVLCLAERLTPAAEAARVVVDGVTPSGDGDEIPELRAALERLDEVTK